MDQGRAVLTSCSGAGSIWARFDIGNVIFNAFVSGRAYRETYDEIAKMDGGETHEEL